MKRRTSDILTCLAAFVAGASLASWSSKESPLLRSFLTVLALVACTEDSAGTVPPPVPAETRDPALMRPSEEAFGPREGPSVIVDIPASAQPASARPRPVLPVVANAHLQSEYAFIDIESAESMAWFTPAELARMTGSTFDDPRVRHVSGTRRIGDAHRSLDLLVVYSPESEDVFVLERTRELPLAEYRARREELRERDEAALVDFLQSLGTPRVSFAADAARLIPASFAGRE